MRAYSNPDSFTSNLEAGNYYNTIGYSSFDLPNVQDSDTAEINFFHTFYEPNTEELAEALNLTTVSI
jgi:hypothetical protein